ncbi:O-antigen ligase family protein [Psychrosphaera sp. B3R10]|uniref:O-antigen ligase family protein n=1 Tax=unclassified Psychrosphaera TaxID=2641570 RepID=UPI001C099E81|nr:MULTISPECIES: O-antigen ligase family protein [unclassified Psychrosphaera]MBU2883717.1 O-antigen ligase family protein [Psychrosphaera sp. I2R16]MBU2987981.1 O-antigen ligase family protein [Psychrosphaera sp. B3R10]
MPITALFFLAIFALGCIYTLKRPFAGLLLYFFVYYMHPPGKYWGSFIPEMRWTLIVALLTLISTFIHEKDLKAWLKPKETKILLLFFGYVCLQLMWVDIPSLHQVYVILLFKLIVLYFLILTLVNTELRLIAVIVANVLGSAYIGLNAIQTHQRGRFEAAGLPGIEDSNLLSIHLIPIILMSSIIILTNLKRKYFIFIPLALTANLFFMAGSRGGLVGLLISGLFFIWYSPKEKKAQIRKWALAALVLGSMLVGPLIMERVNQVVKADDTESVDKSAYSRFVIIEGQWGMFKDHLLAGYGHRGTLILSPMYIDEEFMTKTEAGGRRGSHNITMSFLVDHGVIGSLLYFLFIISTIKNVKLVQSTFGINSNLSLILLSFVAGLVGVMVASQFSNSKVLEISIWLVALVGASVNLSDKMNDKKQQT